MLNRKLLNILLDAEGNMEQVENESQIIDWLSLPPHVESVSLWDCFHDSEIMSVKSDLQMRTVDCMIDNPYIRKFFKLPEDQRFILNFSDVRSSRASRWVWPSKPPIVSGTREEQHRIVVEYQSTWRLESMSWDEFVGAFTSDTFEISNADIAQGKDSVAMHIQGHFYGPRYQDISSELFLSAKQLRVFQNQNTIIEIAQLIAMGTSYWDNFAVKGKGSI
jgi:hypothetical protein